MTNTLFVIKTQRDFDDLVVGDMCNVLGDLKIECNIKAYDIEAHNIEARSITARNIIASDIKAFNIRAKNISAHDIIAHNIATSYIKANNVTARSIITHGIYATNIKINSISYSDFCIARKNIICRKIVACLKMARKYSAGGKITIKSIKQQTKDKKRKKFLKNSI